MVEITVKFDLDQSIYPDTCMALDSGVLVTRSYSEPNRVTFTTNKLSLERLRLTLETLSEIFNEPFKILNMEVK